jgi:four helix bundle protein
MFDFEKLEVYQKARNFNKFISNLLATNKLINGGTRDQLRRASLSIMLNIAEGSSRFSKADRRNFYIISRGSVFECAALFDFLRDEMLIDDPQKKICSAQLEEISKMLFGLIRNYN